MTKSERERTYWLKKSASEYHKSIGEYALKKDKVVLKKLLGGHQGSALDIPCGSGRHSVLLKSLGFDVTSADVSNAMLEATRRIAGTKIKKLDLLKSFKSSDRYNVVLVSRLLFHYQKQAGILSNLKSLLKPNGILIFDTLNKYSCRWFIHKGLIVFGRLFLSKIKFGHEKSLSFTTLSQIQTVLGKLGYKIIDKKSVYLFPTRSYKYIPRVFYKLFASIEAILADRLKVVTFWKVKL